MLSPRSRFAAALLALLSCLSLLAGPAPAQQDLEGARLVAVPAEIRAALARNDFDEALRLLREEEQSDPERADFWLYLQATTARQAQDPDTALAAAQAVGQRYPESAWRHKVRFLEADILRETGRMALAERIYEEEARRLRSAERLGELAEIYLENARRLSTEPETPQPDAGGVDYARAATLYQKVIEIEAPRPQRDEAMFRLAFCRQRLQDWSGAIGLYRAYLSAFDPTEPGSEGARRGAGRSVIDAHFALGECLQSAGDPNGARRSFEDLGATVAAALAGDGGWQGQELPAGEDADEARDRAGEAAFRIALTWPSSAAEAPLAIGALRRFLDAFPGHSRRSEARYRMAGRIAEAGDVEASIAAYRAYLDGRESFDPEEREAEEQRRMSAAFTIGELELRLGRYEKAVAAWSDYVRRFPAGPDWSNAQQRIVEAEYSRAANLAADEEFAAAREAWEAFLEAHPLDARAAAISRGLGDLFAREARQHVEDGDDAAARPFFDQAIAQWRRVARKYPGQEEASRALHAIGLVYERDLGELDAAIRAYRDCNFGGSAGEAARRLAAMLEPSLRLVTERKWRNDESATVTARVRNLENLEVRVYGIDLEAYFRKHLTHQRIGELDLDLIAPDQILEIPIADYAPWKPIEQDLVIPVQGPGAWAVTVTGDELRATTLVLRSDLDVVVKSSRREVFVFAEDMRAGEPAEGVDLLVGVTDGSGAPQLFEARTGADGVARLPIEELRGGQAVRLFARRGADTASQGLGLSGLGFSAGLAPRGFVYSERPAYRPGQTVHWRAIVRDVVGGSYDFDQTAPWRVEIVDPEGRVFHRAEGTLSAFGTLSGDLALDPYASTGSYRIRCATPDGPTFQGGFAVQEYRLRKIDLAFDLPRRVYYRGEEVELAVDAAYYYGDPVADAQVRFQLPDGRTEWARTDANGRAQLRFATRDFPNEGRLEFQAALVEEQVQAAGNVYLALRGFALDVQTPRTVRLAGENFPVRIRATAPDGEPVSRDLMVRVWRTVQHRGGQWREELVRELPITTIEDDGTAELSLRFDDGGEHIVRVEGTDRFQNPILGETRLWISGDEDSTRLRVLTDDLQLEVGEDLRVDLHNRAGAGLALVTVEGEEILDYRLVSLTEGSNAFELPVAHGHFPNFRLGVAMMRGNAFHEASADFSVQRELRVEVEALAESWLPGEDVEVRLRATDQLGRPVAAEIGLAVVDASLFAQHPDRLPKLRAYFESGTERHAAMHTATSCTFRYSGDSEKIAEAVLSELAAAASQEVWKERRDAARQMLALGAQVDNFAAFAVDPVEVPQLAELEYDSDSFHDSIGMGGGAGGRFGGRAGRKRAAGPDGAAAETAYWNPAVRTDEDGSALVRFRIPERSTRWRLTARGVGAGTLLGEATAEVVSRSEFELELRTPDVLVQGDAPRFLARVHNLSGKRGSAELRLRLQAGGESRTLVETVALEGRPIVEVVFDAYEVPGRAESLFAELLAEADLGGRELRASRTALVPVRPWGIGRTVASSGVLRDQLDLRLRLPAGAEYRDRYLELHLGIDVDQLLVSTALSGHGDALLSSRSLAALGGGVPHTLADAGSDLVGVCAVMEMLQRSGRANVPQYLALQDRAKGLIARLVAAQRGDGGWNWISKTHVSQPEVAARSMFALGCARELGLSIPPATLDAGVQYLQEAFRGASQQSDEQKAMIQHALSVHDRGDFAAVNRLHRTRGSLSAAGLAYTALALVQMGRQPMAADVAGTLEQRFAASEDWGAARNAGWNRSSLEMEALAVLALGKAMPQSTRIAAGVESLLGARPWFPKRAQGIVLTALATHRSETVPAAGRVTVSVRMPDGSTEEVRLDGQRVARTLHFAVPDGAAAPQDLQLRVSGRGEPHFTAVLRGFTEELPENRERMLRITRHQFLAAAPTFRGKEVSTGFGVLRTARNRWQNQVENLPFAALCRGHLEFYADARDELAHSDYWLLEVPLPAGVDVLDGSVTGRFESYRVEDGKIVFHVGQHRGSGRIDYTLVGAAPGDYRTRPAVMRSAYDPSRETFAEATPFAVLARGEVSPDDYRPTPDELFHLGSAMYAGGEREAAYPLLLRLFEEFESELEERPLKEAAGMLVFLAIDREEPGPIVRFFEILKEKDPELTIPFDDVLEVGEAYRRLEEYERALLVFRATVDGTFAQDLQVAGVLEQQGEFVAALDALARLVQEFPDLPSVLDTSLAMSDKLLKKAPVAHEDASLRRAGRDRVALTVEGVRLLRRFLAIHPDDPRAAEAGLNLVSAFLELEDYETAADLADRLAARHAEPRFADAFRYTQAVASWYVGEEDRALALLRSIAEAVYDAEDGSTYPSENRDLALYILAQIHHARQEVGEASEYYDRVDEVFADAREVLEAFRARHIELDEVTTVSPGESVEVTLRHRNLEEAELLVYGVDLMTLYLREKNLSNITAVNLAGIAPTVSRTVALGGDDELREQETTVSLALDEPGAYLVICRGDELHTSGLVLVSDLELQVREDVGTGRLRVEVTRESDQRYVRDVDVRVIGSANDSFTSGKTDPRGLFVTEGVLGTSTVIARLDEQHYAFYRGQLALGGVQPQRGVPTAGSVLRFEQAGESSMDKAGYLQNVMMLNDQFQEGRAQQFQAQVESKQEGVKIKAVQ